MSKVQVQDRQALPIFIKVMSDHKEVEIVKLTPRQMGFKDKAILGAVQGRALDMGLKRLSETKVADLCLAYARQEINESGLAIADGQQENEHNLYMLGNYSGNGRLFSSRYEKHTFLCNLDDVFFFEK